jgi:hypothetical protein
MIDYRSRFQKKTLILKVHSCALRARWDPQSFWHSFCLATKEKHPAHLLCSSWWWWSSSSSSRSDISLPTSSHYFSFLQPRRRRRQRCFFPIPFKIPIPQRSKQAQPLDLVRRTKSKKGKKGEEGEEEEEEEKKEKTT